MEIAKVQGYTPISREDKIKIYTRANATNPTTGFNPFQQIDDFDAKVYKDSFEKSLEDKKEEIYDYLNHTKIMSDGHIAPVIEHIKALFQDDSKEYWQGEIMHHSKYADIIKKEGFDFSKIKNTVFGPAIYFATSEDELGMYEGDTVHADFQGNIAYGKYLDNYNRVNTAIENSIRSRLGVANNFGMTTMAEHEVLHKFIDEYVRKQIVNVLGIDGAYNQEGQYFAVFNPDSLSNVH